MNAIRMYQNDFIPTPATDGHKEVKPNEMEHVNSSYFLKFPKYAALMNDMIKNSRGVLCLEESLHFLQKRSGNYLLINDQPKNKLSLGPSKSISNLKLVQMRVSKTGCWITYSASQYGQSSRVSSSYVSINQDGLDSGRITQIFYHIIIC